VGKTWESPQLSFTRTSTPLTHPRRHRNHTSPISATPKPHSQAGSEPSAESLPYTPTIVIVDDMEPAEFATIHKALSDICGSDSPTTTRAVKQLATAATEAADKIRDWANELGDILDNLTQTADDLTEADRDSRDDAHTVLCEAADQALAAFREVGIQEVQPAAVP
jgi:cytochrome P450